MNQRQNSTTQKCVCLFIYLFGGSNKQKKQKTKNMREKLNISFHPFNECCFCVECEGAEISKRLTHIQPTGIPIDFEHVTLASTTKSIRLFFRCFFVTITLNVFQRKKSVLYSGQISSLYIYKHFKNVPTYNSNTFKSKQIANYVRSFAEMIIVC